MIVKETNRPYPLMVINWYTEKMYQDSLKLHPDWKDSYWLEVSRANMSAQLDELFDALGDEKELIDENAPDEWYANNKEYSWSFYSQTNGYPQSSNYVHLNPNDKGIISQMQTDLTNRAKAWCEANGWMINTNKLNAPNQLQLIILTPKLQFDLRGDFKANDRRLGRIPQWDERNKNFDAKNLLSADQKVPITFTWECDIHLDQGNTPSCVGHAWAHQFISKPKIVKNVDEAYALNIYNIAKTLDEYPGTNYDGTSTMGGAKAAMQLGKIESYHWCLDIETLKLVVSLKKPVCVGTNWYNKMFSPDSNGFVHIGNGIAGGHEYLVKGYNVEGDYFICHNSWGTSFGINGDFKISAADLNRLVFQEGGDACVCEHMSV